MIASNGRDNAKETSIDGATTLGDEGESRRSRDELCPGDHTRDDLVECIGTIKRSERLLSRLPDQILLSILGAKVGPSFLN